MNLAVIIPAAGASRRYAQPIQGTGLDPARSKLDEDLGGRPVLQRTVEIFTKRPEVSLIVVAGPADQASYNSFQSRHADKLGLLGVKLCRGGATHRYETVHNALKEIPDACTHVAVHDAARPCATDDLIDRVLRAAEHHAAVIPAIDVADTLKRVAETPLADDAHDPLAAILGPDTGGLGGGSGDNAGGTRAVETTIDRRNLVAVQTPQVFRAELLRRAYAQPDLASTDDAQLVERLGERVVVVDGDPTNIKVTRPADLRLARAILGLKPPAERAVHKRF